MILRYDKEMFKNIEKLKNMYEKSIIEIFFWKIEKKNSTTQQS